MTAKTRELLLLCPSCGATCGVSIDTTDLTTVECSGCGETIDPADAAETLRLAAARWEAFAAWLTAASAI